MQDKSEELKSSLRKIFDLKGHSRRTEYWTVLTGLIVIYLVLIPLIGLIAYSSQALGIPQLSFISLMLAAFLGKILPIALAIVLIALVVRRLRDAKISKVLFGFVLLASPILSLVILMSLPAEMIEKIRILGRENILLASTLLIIFVLALPFVVLGFVPSKKN